MLQRNCWRQLTQIIGMNHNTPAEGVLAQAPVLWGIHCAHVELIIQQVRVPGQAGGTWGSGVHHPSVSETPAGETLCLGLCGDTRKRASSGLWYHVKRSRAALRCDDTTAPSDTLDQPGQVCSHSSLPTQLPQWVQPSHQRSKACSCLHLPAGLTPLSPTHTHTHTRAWTCK